MSAAGGRGRRLGGDGLRWGLIAATNMTAAERFASVHGISPSMIIDREDLLSAGTRVGELFRSAPADAVMVHSTDWRRQRTPQLYELALAAIPAKERMIVDEAAGIARILPRARAGARVSALPVQALDAGIAVAREGLHFVAARGVRRGRPVAGQSAAVLAVWPGTDSMVGGAVSHITGILSAFRRAGLRVGLVTFYPPPEQLRSAIDELEVCASLPAAARLTGDTAEMISNRRVREAACALARRLPPSFIYQRHGSFLFAGAELSRRWQVPLVLEWNASEVWTRSNWSRRFAIERLLDPLALAVERFAAKNATLVAGVSEEAVAMAVAAGAAIHRAIVLPNGVDLRYVDNTLMGGTEGPHANPSAQGRRATWGWSSQGVVGWAGSFASWHGGQVIIQALSRLPGSVQLLMVGDGPDRGPCVSLATELGVAERIEWTGALPHRDALRRLAACDVLVSPQTPLPGQSYFQSPIKLFEYMALGRPIVASRLGQIIEILDDGRTGRLVEPANVGELAGAINELLHSPDRGRALGAAARREAERHHTWDQRAQIVMTRLGLQASTKFEDPDRGSCTPRPGAERP